MVHADVGVKTLAEFVALAKKKPGSLDFASTGAGIDTVHIPYKRGAPALQDLLGGRIASYYATPATAGPHIESGKLIPLATTGPSRPAFMPHVPTIPESGYPGFNATNWYAFVAFSKTPKPLLDRWNLGLVKVLNAPDVREQLLKHGLTPQPGTRDELARYMASESATWGKAVRERKILAE